MAEEAKGYSDIAGSILVLLQNHPSGLDIHELRHFLKNRGPQQHLDRRLRELDPHFVISRMRVGRRSVYKYEGIRPAGEWDFEQISKQLRAQVLDTAKGRCQMCGKTIKQDGVRMHIDHKIPRSWGGKTEIENLWAICSVCNEGKRDYYATFSPELMEKILAFPGVHNRIAHLLNAMSRNWVDRDLIEFVANFDDFQEDWQKRLRELRYLGFNIETKREKKGRRTLSFYRLQNWIPFTEDLGIMAKRYEANRASKRKGSEEA